jgi:hypothetical protein
MANRKLEKIFKIPQSRSQEIFRKFNKAIGYSQMFKKNLEISRKLQKVFFLGQKGIVSKDVTISKYVTMGDDVKVNTDVTMESS